MSDLFAHDEGLQRLSMRDAAILFQRHLLLDGYPELIMHSLISAVPWRQDHVAVWGKRHPQPRLTAWYGDPLRSYTYSGVTMHPEPWSESILALKKRVEEASGSLFNSVLLNYYRDGRDSMGFHSDDERELGLRPTIASLSLGETRVLVFKHKRDALVPDVRLSLTSGSLLVMAGETQENWKHGIAKESRPCGPRVNLTFRTIRTGAEAQPSRPS